MVLFTCLAQSTAEDSWRTQGTGNCLPGMHHTTPRVTQHSRQYMEIHCAGCHITTFQAFHFGVVWPRRYKVSWSGLRTRQSNIHLSEKQASVHLAYVGRYVQQRQADAENDHGTRELRGSFCDNSHSVTLSFTNKPRCHIGKPLGPTWKFPALFPKFHRMPRRLTMHRSHPGRSLQHQLHANE